MENTQANSILEKIHQVISNLIHIFDLQNNYLDKDEPWSDILEATDFAVQSRYHTMLQATIGQLVFRLNIIFNAPLVSYWGAIGQHKRQLIDKKPKQKIKIANHIHT